MTGGGDGPAWSLEADVRPEGWDDTLRDALRPLSQGSLVRDPPITYYASPERPLTHTTKRFAEVRTTNPSAVTPLDRPPWGIITTQTCDLIEEGRPKRPWFSIAPVYVYECDAGLERQIRTRCFSYLFAVTNLNPVASGLWVADLRLEVPIEKSWLIGADTQDAFATQQEYWAFSMHLGELRTRFAYPRDIERLFLTPCREKLKILAARYPGNFEARFRVGKNSEDPQSVGLVLMFEKDPPAGLRSEMDQWWVDTFQDGSLDFHVVEPLITSIGDVDPRDFEAMRPFDTAAPD